ncbi:MAG: DegV family protein [Smithellaceae bacterium]
MDEVFHKAFITGVERVAAWADLLDSINVYPIADGDTGRNLFISLTPLLTSHREKETIIRQLLLSARGNSGNIASRFFSAFYLVDSLDNLHDCAQEGKRRAWKAVNDPRPGTMLTVFDTLVESLMSGGAALDQKTIDTIINRLEKSVHDTCEMLPKLKEAGVVDAGALGMYIFFEGFFYSLAGTAQEFRPVTELFKNRLHISPAFQEDAETGYCVDFVVKAQNLSKNELAKITEAQDSVIVIPEGDLYKIHLHTDDREKIRGEAARLGNMVNWEDDNLNQQINEFRNARSNNEMHIMTDAAGSLTRADAQKNGITLLHSYITLGEKCLPETHLHSGELYAAMRQGIKVSTSQASLFERHQFYESVLDRFEKVLYLCVGSVYTGNYAGALEWKKQHDLQNRFIIIDTGAASGRLAAMVLAANRYLIKTNDMGKTTAFVSRALQVCEEYVFLDKLEYLAAGGRLSKTSAFFGDVLKMKPVISPQPEGARKVGVVRNTEDQIKMARERLAASLGKDEKALIMLEYSDNYDLVNDTVKPLIAASFPHAEIIIHQLSLTSGAHMGPGTWAVAFLPETTL